MSLVVSISGVRGVVGDSFIPEVVVKYTAAFADYSGQGRIILGRDGRPSGKLLANIASSTLLAMGRDVLAIGVCPTPTVQLAVERSDAVGGIVITASHNPAEWNGMKFVGVHGMFLDDVETRRLWELAESVKPMYARWNRLGNHTVDDSYRRKHLDMVLSLPYINVDRVKKRKFKVVVDCVNAAGSEVIPELLENLGCVVIRMNCEASGVFPHNPEPIPEHLTALCDRVLREKADFGIAVDPDADRLVLITEKGEPFGEEYTIASVVKFILQRMSSENASPQRVVVNLSTTRAVDDIARAFGAEVIRTPVGEINVAKKMKEVNALVGGEGSGGVILPAVHYGRDAVVGIGLVLEMLAEFNGTMTQLKASLPQYSIVKSKVQIDSAEADGLLHALRERHSADARTNTDDGLKIDFPDAWIHLRKSNTEPIVRIIAEARTQAEAVNLVEQFRRSIYPLNL